MILMIQKKIVTSGTLLSIRRPVVAASFVRAVVMGRDTANGPLNAS